MEQSIQIMANRITRILSDNAPSICLFGSVVLDDFKPGWSDIDILCLTQSVMNEEQAQELVHLRQTLLAEYPGNPYFRLFEGGFLTLDAFLNNREDRVVYWGTSGQRLENRYDPGPFAKIELIENGRLLCGEDFRTRISYPDKDEILEAVKNEYYIVRKYGDSGPGWILGIARCLYTLKTYKVIAKTKAGEWALAENCCPDPEVMKRVLEVRRNPALLKDEETKQWAQTLKTPIQQFADVLEVVLLKAGCCLD